MIFTTLLLPLEVRILPSYEAIQKLGPDEHLYTGLIVPLIASATGTFFFRQFFMSVPEELAEAARIDGAGPWKFFIDILVPLSRTMIAAIFIIMFVFGWNQYLWPTLITTDESFFTLVRGIKQIVLSYTDSQIPEHGQALALGHRCDDPAGCDRRLFPELVRQGPHRIRQIRNTRMAQVSLEGIRKIYPNGFQGG